MKKLFNKIKDKFSNVSKKKLIIIGSIIALILIIFIVNTMNQRRLDVLNNEIKYSDVKNITITRIDKSKTFVDNESMKKIYFLLYRYGKSTSRKVVKDFELHDKETIILNINKEYDIYLYKDEGNYYMGYMNYASYKISEEDYNMIASFLDGDGKNG